MTMTDNRDPHTTTLTLTRGGTIDIDPIDLYINMVENCYENRSDVDMSDLQGMVDYLNGIINK